MKPRLITFLLLSAIFQINLSAQSNYVDGYVVTLKGDTLNGEIYFANMAKNPDKIRFRKNEVEEPYLFNPGNIESFHAAGDYYVRAYVKSEITLSDDHLLTTNQDYQFKSDSAFLRVLVDGPKQLLRYENYVGNINYYISTDSGYQYLWHKTFLKEKGGAYIKVQNNRYIGQLAIYFSDCDAIKGQLPELKYDNKRLIKLFESYYSNCSNYSYVIPKTKSPWQWSFGALAGITKTSVSFRTGSTKIFSYIPIPSDNPYFTPFTKSEFIRTFDATGGIYANVYLPRSNKKWSIYNEALITSYTVYNTDIYTSNNYFKINNMLRYEIPVREFRVITMVGMSNGYAYQSILKRKNHPDAGIKTTRFEQGIILGTGIGYKRFALEARFTFSDGISGDPHLQSRVRRTYFLLSYRIFDQKK